jgi:hypothetical protein
MSHAESTLYHPGELNLREGPSYADHEWRGRYLYESRVGRYGAKATYYSVRIVLVLDSATGLSESRWLGGMEAKE